MEPEGDAGALRNDEMFFEQHGVISSSNDFADVRKKLDNSFSDGCVEEVIKLLDVASPFMNVLLPPMLAVTFDTLIFLRGIWLTCPVPATVDATDVVASQRTFFFFAELRTLTSFLENA